jgi:glycosyltransferase involved in cell wall biosynthesis
VEAVNKLADTYPAMKGTTGVAILGGHAEEIESMLKLPVYPLGYVNNEQRIVHIYNTADVFVLPSLEDNLPNTLMEAMACGVPCVGFQTGGIPEMIDHLQNGYVAQFRQAEDLARGIHYVLTEVNYKELSANCVQKVARCYSQQSVAKRYLDVYEAACQPVKKNDR